MRLSQYVPAFGATMCYKPEGESFMGFEATEQEVTLGAFWRTVGSRPVGATVITASHNGVHAGFLGLSFAHVSAAPPTVLVSAGKNTSALPVIRDAGHFAVNLLPAGAEDMARMFGGDVAMTERFAAGQWESFVTGAPILQTAAAVFDCQFQMAVEDDGAVILIGRVKGVRTADNSGVTIAYQGGYRDF